MHLCLMIYRGDSPVPCRWGNVFTSCVFGVNWKCKLTGLWSSVTESSNLPWNCSLARIAWESTRRFRVFMLALPTDDNVPLLNAVTLRLTGSLL